MTCEELALALEQHVPEDQRSACVVTLNHSDSGSSMYGICLLTRARLTIVPGGGMVLLLSSHVGFCPDEPVDESALLQHPDLLKVGDLVRRLRRLGSMRVFHTINDSRYDDHVWADLSELWPQAGPVFRPAGPQLSVTSMMDEEAMVEWPPSVSLWNGGDFFEIHYTHPTSH